FFFQAEDGIRDFHVTGVQTCALPILAIAFFASLGLPGFSAFIGEAFVIIGAFNAESMATGVPRWMAIGGSIGILLSAAYFLWTRSEERRVGRECRVRWER